jgi:hypothetical protein
VAFDVYKLVFPVARTYRESAVVVLDDVYAVRMLDRVVSTLEMTWLHVIFPRFHISETVMFPDTLREDSVPRVSKLEYMTPAPSVFAESTLVELML